MTNRLSRLNDCKIEGTALVASIEHSAICHGLGWSCKSSLSKSSLACHFYLTVFCRLESWSYITEKSHQIGICWLEEFPRKIQSESGKVAYVLDFWWIIARSSSQHFKIVFLVKIDWGTYRVGFYFYPKWEQVNSKCEVIWQRWKKMTPTQGGLLVSEPVGSGRRLDSAEKTD